MHAVALLNAVDGGSRQSILVTNNEVSAVEAADLAARDVRAGDQEWEALGIFHHVTKPRVEAAITGRTPAGKPVGGDYLGMGTPLAEGLSENAEFFELTYEDPDLIGLGESSRPSHRFCGWSRAAAVAASQNLRRIGPSPMMRSTASSSTGHMAGVR